MDSLAPRTSARDRSRGGGYPHYSGSLGMVFDPNDRHAGAVCTLWAPAARAVTLQLGATDSPSDLQPVQMLPVGDGAWRAELKRDVWGCEYVFDVDAPSERTRTVDPYARAVTANGQRGVAIDPELILPAPRRMPPLLSPTDAVIYEVHVRDLTISTSNGIACKGGFLGLVEPGTRTEAGRLSGLDYLCSLGVSHVQLLPVFDFATVDELGDRSFGAQYNWGYDPAHYNAVEGSYSTDPSDPLCRIREFRTLVDTLHARGLRVIMDVVYNHVFDAYSHPFQLTAPNYFFRTNSSGEFVDGSFCGNETASERSMMRRYMVDSMTYWARVFGVDGFRLDLMGLHDVATMNAVRSALDAIDPGILLLGEGWKMGNVPSSALPADHTNARLMPGIAMFNDVFRDSAKGSVFDTTARGFVSGGGQGAMLLDAHLGSLSTRTFLSAAQSVVYNEAHDNLTMFDKLMASGVDRPVRRHMLATTIQVLSRGVVFVHAGQEICRTKNGDENSYRSPDSVNAFDYDRAAEFPQVLALMRDLLEFRHKHAWLREAEYTQIAARTQVLACTDEHIAYVVERAFGDHPALVAINGSDYTWHLPEAWGLGDVRAVHIADARVYLTPRDQDADSDRFPLRCSGMAVAPLSVTVAELE